MHSGMHPESLSWLNTIHPCLIIKSNVCSAGDTAQGLAQGTQYWAFRGRRVVAALADQLAARQGLGNATDVLVAGDSAGGVSALNNADFMLQRVKASLPRCKDVRFSDGLLG